MNKKQLPTGVRVLLGFVSVLLCIVLFACSLITILVADLGLLTSKGGLQKLIQDVLFSTSAPARPGFAPAGVLPGRSPIHMDEADMGGVDLGGFDFGSIDLSGIVSGDGATDVLIDTIYGILEEQGGEDLPISKEDVTNFVEQSTLPEFISDKVSGIVVDVINGEVTTTITKEDVVQLLEENKELIEDTFQTEIPEEVIESVGEFVEESKISESIQQSVAEIVGVELPPATVPGDAPQGSDSPDADKPGTATKPSTNKKPLFRPGDLEVLEGLTSGNVENVGIGEALALVRIVTSPAVLIGCIAVCLLISALLFLTNWGRPNTALRCSGISYFIAGLLFLIPSAVATFAPSLFAGLGIVGNAIRQVLALAGTISLGVTLFGLALIIGGAVWGSALKKKRIAAAADTATAVAVEETTDLAEALLAVEETPAEEPAEAAAEETEV